MRYIDDYDVSDRGRGPARGALIALPVGVSVWVLLIVIAWMLL